MKKKKSYFLITIIGFGLLFAFNNCGEFNAETELTSTALVAACDNQLKSVFQKTYHPFLTRNCTLCHSQAQGSRTLNIAYDAFMARGESLIEYQSTNAHGGNNFDGSLINQINAFKPTWNRAKENYSSCLENAARYGNFTSLRTVSKAIPNIMGTAQNNSWVGIEWDLETESEGIANNHFKAILRIEARVNLQNGVVSGLFLRNPSMRLKPGSDNIAVNGLTVYVDGSKQTAVTTYLGLIKIVDRTTAVNLVDASGAAYVSYPNFSAQTTLGLEFTEIRNTTQSSNNP